VRGETEQGISGVHSIGKQCDSTDFAHFSISSPSTSLHPGPFVLICSDHSCDWGKAIGMLVHVQLAERSYDVVVHRDDMAGIGAFARARNRERIRLRVADANVRAHADAVAAALAAASFKVARTEIAPGESQKCLASAFPPLLYDRLAEMNADRKTLVVAVGGGVIGDLAGFAAATYNRGLPLLMAPTTLLAMVDSSVGGKVGVNHRGARTLIGAFHQARGRLDRAGQPRNDARSRVSQRTRGSDQYGVIRTPVFWTFWKEISRDLEAAIRKLSNTS